MTYKIIRRVHPALRDAIGALITQRPVPGPHLDQVDPFPLDDVLERENVGQAIQERAAVNGDRKESGLDLLLESPGGDEDPVAGGGLAADEGGGGGFRPGHQVATEDMEDFHGRFSPKVT